MVKRGITISKLRDQLGKKYTIKVIDLERCLYRDFGNGFNVEISGVDTRSTKKTATLYLWFGDTVMNCLMIRPIIKEVPREAPAIHFAVELLYKYSKRLLEKGLNTQEKLYGYVDDIWGFEDVRYSSWTS